MDHFQQESGRLRALVDAEPSPERLAQVRTAIASKYQGIQHLAASVLAAWIRRGRQTRRPGLGSETECVDLLRRWLLSIPTAWSQSLAYSSRLITSFVRLEDLDWIFEVYSIRGRHCDLSDIRLPDACVARLKLIATNSTSPSASYEAERWLRKFDWEGKQEFQAERLRATGEVYRPHPVLHAPRNVDPPSSGPHDRRRGHAHRRRRER